MIWMNVCCQMTSLEIYEWMCKFIRYHKNTVHSLTHTLNTFVPIFIFKNDNARKETITSNWYGWKFPALGWLFLQYRLLVKDYYILAPVKMAEKPVWYARICFLEVIWLNTWSQRFSRTWNFQMSLVWCKTN